MSTEQAIAESPAVVAQTAKIIGVQSATLQNAAAKRLTVTVPASTLTTSNVLQITWTAPTAQAAQTGANAFAAAYLSYRHRELEGQVANLRTGYERELSSIGNQISQLTGQVNRAQPRSPALARLYFQLTQLRQQGTNISSSLASLANYNISGGSQISAALPTTRSGLGRKVILTLGILLGLLIGLVLAFIRDAFDDRVRTPAQLERSSGVPTLAVLPAAERSGRLAHGERHTGSAVAVVASPDSRAADAVRALRATLTIVAERQHLARSWSPRPMPASRPGASRPRSGWHSPSRAVASCWSPPTCAARRCRQYSACRTRPGLVICSSAAATRSH